MKALAPAPEMLEHRSEVKAMEAITEMEEEEVKVTVVSVRDVILLTPSMSVTLTSSTSKTQ